MLRAGGKNGNCRSQWQEGRDHRRESVVQTGEASNLGRQPDLRATAVALTCEAGGRSPRPNHVLTHVVISQFAPAIGYVLRPVDPSCFPSALNRGALPPMHFENSLAN